MRKPNFGETLALTTALFAADVSPHKTVDDPFTDISDREEKNVVEKESFKEFILQTEIDSLYRNPNYFVYYDNGEFSDEEKKERQEFLSGIGTIFHDVGLDFYTVQEGDTLEGIRKKLTPMYPYLENQKRKINGFNINPKDIVSEMRLPIPIPKDERKISDQEFLKFAYETLDQIMHDPEYGEYIVELREHFSDEKIVSTLLAIAKQESGGKPIGQFEIHRYERGSRSFSYSIFHILMKGPGETARKELGMTIGQTYHPGNAIKLFFGFFIEKILEGKNRSKRKDVENAKIKLVRLFFELDEDFASFYNGRSWKEKAPDYLENVQGYYREAQNYFGKNGMLVTNFKKGDTP